VWPALETAPPEAVTPHEERAEPVRPVSPYSEAFSEGEDEDREPAPRVAVDAGEPATERPDAVANGGEGAVATEGFGFDDKGVPLTAAEAAAHKRRRRRGGRGRKKHVAGEPADASSPSRPPSAPDREEHAGVIVWEDSPDGPEEIAASAPGTHGSGPGGDDSAELGPDGQPGAKKRRRRRGGRGRGKGTAADAPVRVAAEGGRISKNGSEAAERPTGSKPPREGEHDADAHKKRRRRRGGKKLETAHEVGVARPPGRADRGETVGARAPAPVSAGDEDVPGGWWSRLRGPKKRGDRED